MTHTTRHIYNAEDGEGLISLAQFMENLGIRYDKSTNPYQKLIAWIPGEEWQLRIEPGENVFLVAEVDDRGKATNIYSTFPEESDGFTERLQLDK